MLPYSLASCLPQVSKYVQRVSFALSQSLNAATVQLCINTHLSSDLLPRRAAEAVSLSIALPWVFRLSMTLPWLAYQYVILSFLTGGASGPAVLTILVYGAYLFNLVGYPIPTRPLRNASTRVPFWLLILHLGATQLVRYELVSWRTLSFWPILFLVAVWTAASLPASHLPTDPDELEQGAEEVAESYEVRWEVYRHVSLVSAALWIYGVYNLARSPGYLAHILVVATNAVAPSYSLDWTQFQSPWMLWLRHEVEQTQKYWTSYDDRLAIDTAVFLILPLLVLIMETSSIRALPSLSEPRAARHTEPRHPLTNRPFSSIEQKASVALELAPAGTPSMEAGLRKPWHLAIQSILAGPGFPLSLWWSAGEERSGWLARAAILQTMGASADQKVSRIQE